MSYKATAWAYELELPSPRKFVLVALADFADENGTCFPSQHRLMRMTGLGERAVRNSLRALEDEGLIMSVARYEDGRRIPNRYRLSMLPIPAPRAGSVPARQTEPTGTSVPNLPAPRAGEEPPVNHQKNHQLTSEVAEAPSRPDVERLLDLLDSEIVANGGRKPSRTKKNRDAIRLMLDRDGISEADVAGAIRWCQHDEFWRANILSASKLRAKYETLRLQAQRGPRARAEQRTRDHLDVIAQLQAEERES